MPIACIGRDLRVLRPSSSHLHQPSATLLATRPLPLHLHLKRGRDLVPLLWPRGRPASTRSRRHAVTARFLPPCPHGRQLLAAAATPPDCLRRPLLRCPHLRCLLTESRYCGARTFAAFSPKAPAPPHTTKQCTRARRRPFCAWWLQRLSRDCAGLRSPRFVLTVPGAPGHMSRYPKTDCSRRIQGTPNY